ncbi:MAG: PQQ-dependent sugar dehydrogenase [Phycisphaerales bacterium]|nr:PQQ-dependent sugar dehydrogenase [Phycisphaerales bacterium]
MPNRRCWGIVLVLAAAEPGLAQTEAAGVPDFTVRQGYAVEVAVPDLPGARFLQLDERGHLYISRPRQKDIIAMADTDGDGQFEQLGTFVSGRELVHGMQFFDGWLYFASNGQIERGRDTDGDGKADEVEKVLSDLPSGGGHWWRSVLVTDRYIYTSIGDEGNITDMTASEREKIWRFNRDGSGKSLFVSGIRNTEKLRLRPGTDEVWGFDHGSDWFGRGAGDVETDQPVTNLNPPDELNHYEEGGFYGHPFITGLRVPRYEFLDRQDIHELAKNTTPPAWPMGAHWACDGWTFLNPKINAAKGGFPADHAGDILVACHGSWNSSIKVGYCIARVMFDKDPIDAGKPVGLLKLVSCLGPNDEVLGRPVDVVQAPDGSVLFSVDYPTARVYRLRYSGQ